MVLSLICLGFFWWCLKGGNKASSVTQKSTTGIEEGGDNNEVEGPADVSPHEVCCAPKYYMSYLFFKLY